MGYHNNGEQMDEKVMLIVISLGLLLYLRNSKPLPCTAPWDSIILKHGGGREAYGRYNYIHI